MSVIGQCQYPFTDRLPLIYLAFLFKELLNSTRESNKELLSLQENEDVLKSNQSETLLLKRISESAYFAEYSSEVRELIYLLQL